MNFSKFSIFNVSASIILTTINISTNIIESRILGPGGIGLLNIFVSTQTLFTTIFALGIGQAAIYFINSQKISEYEILSTAIKSLIPLSALCSVVLFVFIKTLDEYFSIVSNLSLIVFVLGTFSLLLTTIFRPVLFVKVEVVKSQIVQYSSALLLLINIITVASATGGKLTLDAVLILIGISNIFALLILFYFFRKRFSFK
jgi:O-antigen/teichoic acid export membrane protein